jgi:hypothetical protein
MIVNASVRRCAFVLSAVVASIGMAAHADTIILKSGDTFTGTITRIGPDTIDVTTKFAGPIKVVRDTVRTLRSDGQVTIVNPQGEEHKAGQRRGRLRRRSRWPRFRWRR